eukprot:2753737-Amphidinium_carterae.1
MSHRSKSACTSLAILVTLVSSNISIAHAHPCSMNTRGAAADLGKQVEFGSDYGLVVGWAGMQAEQLMKEKRQKEKCTKQPTEGRISIQDCFTTFQGAETVKDGVGFLRARLSDNVKATLARVEALLPSSKQSRPIRR